MIEVGARIIVNPFQDFLVEGEYGALDERGVAQKVYIAMRQLARDLRSSSQQERPLV
jgi:hypothetical protein